MIPYTVDFINIKSNDHTGHYCDKDGSALCNADDRQTSKRDVTSQLSWDCPKLTVYNASNGIIFKKTRQLILYFANYIKKIVRK